MAEQPTAVTQVTEEEVEARSINSPRFFKWQFPEEVFDGTWWEIEVPSSKVMSATNSFRNQCESVYGTRATVRKGDDGQIFVKRLTDKKTEAKS